MLQLILNNWLHLLFLTYIDVIVKLSVRKHAVKFTPTIDSQTGFKMNDRQLVAVIFSISCAYLNKPWCAFLVETPPGELWTLVLESLRQSKSTTSNR